MNTQYIRVIPRDLFNESKLLKCIGRLTLLIHDGFIVGDMTFEHDDTPFKIGLTDDGFLSIKNIIFKIHGTVVFFKCLYNSENRYSLFCEYEYCDYLVFDEEGQYTDEFKQFCDTLKQIRP